MTKRFPDAIGWFYQIQGFILGLIHDGNGRVRTRLALGGMIAFTMVEIY